MPSVNPVVYNRTSLLSWQAELAAIELQITEYLQFIEDQRQRLRSVQNELVSQNSLGYQLDVNMASFQDMMDSRPRHYGNYTVETFPSERRSNRLQEQREALKKRMKPYEEAINKAQASMAQLLSRQEWLQKHIPAAQLFLQTLHERPLESVQSLINKIWEAFTHYEDTHLTDLAPQVRISLFTARYGLNTLTSYVEGYDPAYTNSLHRTNYLRLCGFLWDMYSRVKQEKKDPEFEKLLGHLVESTHMVQQGDLPDHMQTGYSAQAWFESNKQNMPGLFAIKEQDLPSLEEQIFKNGLIFITQNRITQQTPLQKHILNTVNLIDAEVKMKKRRKEKIDYHFYGRMLTLLNSAFVNPADQHAAKCLGDIAEYASGSNAVGKKVLGGLLIAAGCLLICASVAGFFTTFGSSSLLSAWGIALGLGLLETELVFGVASSLAAVTGIGLTFFAGPKAIESGARKGLALELKDIKEELEHYNAPPSYSGVVY
ncbi:hypothetical protein [Legionella sp. 227]|uniref:hypothetical protein n=1 Tax=Legionella sp. 227 TaxID=3367288 RepID=UPI00370D1A2B